MTIYATESFEYIETPLYTKRKIKRIDEILETRIREFLLAKQMRNKDKNIR